MAKSKGKTSYTRSVKGHGNLNDDKTFARFPFNVGIWIIVWAILGAASVGIFLSGRWVWNNIF